MIMCMKCVSLGYDIDNELLDNVPLPNEFCGYIFNVIKDFPHHIEKNLGTHVC